MNMENLEDMPELIDIMTEILNAQEDTEKKRESSSVESWHTTTSVSNSDIDLMDGMIHKLLEVIQKSEGVADEEKFDESLWVSLSLIIFGYIIGIMEPNGPYVQTEKERSCAAALENLEKLHAFSKIKGKY